MARPCSLPKCRSPVHVRHAGLPYCEAHYAEYRAVRRLMAELHKRTARGPTARPVHRDPRRGRR